MKIKVGVIYGGETVEHEVSIITAVQAMNHINRDKYEIIPIYISKDRTWYTGRMFMEMDVYKDFDTLKRYAQKVVLYKKGNGYYLQSMGLFKKTVAELDIAFPIVHGNGVEDGSLQGYLETIGIPYVGSDVTGSALGQDKVVMKQIFSSTGIPSVPYTWFFDTEFLTDSDDIIKRINKLGYPVIVKPATLGSSVGITFVKEEKDLASAINDAISYDNKIVVEKIISNLIEVNCSVLGNYEYQEVSAIEEVMSTKEFLSYSDKYVNGDKNKVGKMSGSKGMAGANRIIPARISDSLSLEVKKYAMETFRVLNLTGVCRIDFLIDGSSGKIYVNEPNTIPGSLSFYLWEPVGKNYSKLLDEMITLGIRKYKNKNKKTHSFDTNILKNFSGVKGIKGMKGKIR